MFRCLFNKKDEVIDIKALEKINVCKVCGKQFDLIKKINILFKKIKESMV